MEAAAALTTETALLNLVSTLANWALTTLTALLMALSALIICAEL
jgi:hypothetical protein